MYKIGRSLAAIGAGLTLAASSGKAQTLFSGSGCSGDKFLFCASWTMTYIDVTHLSLLVTNTSQDAPANNSLSAFTQVAIGNVNLADPQGMAAITGWQFEPSINGFNGFGLLGNQFGARTTNGSNDALVDNTSLLYNFAFGASIGTFANAQTATAGAQIAIHDQGFSVSGCGAKGVMAGNATGQNTSNLVGCDGTGVGGNSIGGNSVVPEPGTYVLIAAGLAGLFVVARWRRAGSRETI